MFKDFFVFPNTHLWFIQKFPYIHSLLTHTSVNFKTITHKITSNKYNIPSSLNTIYLISFLQNKPPPKKETINKKQRIIL